MASSQLHISTKTDCVLQVRLCTAAVVEVLATHYFYTLTSEWPLYALAGMAGQEVDAGAAQQGIATLGALAGSLHRGAPASTVCTCMHAHLSLAGLAFPCAAS